MQLRNFPKLANIVASLSSLLAVTAFLASSWQAQAQSSTAAPRNQAGPAHGGSFLLEGHTAPQVLDGRATLLHRYNPEQKLRLVLAVKPPHMAEEEQFLQELQTRGTPNFHKFLTPEQWNARFAPSAEDEQKVVDWAESQGFTVTNRYAHRLIVDVEAPAGVIENAFNVTMNNYEVDGKVRFANDRDPILPSHLAGIVYSVQGLNNIQRMHGSRVGSDDIEVPDYIPGPVVGFKGSDRKDGDPSKLPAIRHANGEPVPPVSNGELDPSDLYSSETYNWAGLQALSHCCNVHNDSTGSPPQTSVAIAGFGDFLGTDIAGFQAAYPYLAYNYTAYTIDGPLTCNNGTTIPAPCADGETTEDIEWTIATSNSLGSANNTAHVYIYEAGNFQPSTYTTMYSQMLDDAHARVFTTSWSGTEIEDFPKTQMDSQHTIFNSMLGQGWTLVSASGDRGAADDCQNNVPKPPAPQYDPNAQTSLTYPASDIDFVAAGGTQLHLDSNGNFSSEAAWQGGTGIGSCKSNGGGSGGGVSVYSPQPSWQSSLSSFGSKRLSPDISLNALGEGQNEYVNGAMDGDANGTSVVSPELAGFFAQENTYLNYIGNICGTDGTTACTPVGNPNSFIYEDAIDGAPHDPFYNMLSGCNDNDATQLDGLTYFCAGPGHSFDASQGTQYNLVSGWGSVNVMQLAWGINWELIKAYGTPSVNFNSGNPATNTWYNTNQSVYWTVSDAGSGGLPAPGNAGFTQGWDSIPADPYSEPHGGSGNSFYSGPEFPFAGSGCLAFEANGCSGGAGQGCHTVQIEAWDNQGRTAYGSYGPLCYDTVAPTITIGNSPVAGPGGWFNSPITVTLTPTDPGGSEASGIYRTYYGVDTLSCSPTNLGGCTTYSAPFIVSGQGGHLVFYFTEDNAGNFSSETYENVEIDTNPPTIAIANNPTTPASGWFNTPVTVTLTPTDPGGSVASGIYQTYYGLDTFACSPTYVINCAVYTGPVNVSGQGGHVFYYFTEDNAGNFSTEPFEWINIDITPPVTTAGLSGTLFSGDYENPVQVTLYPTDTGGSGLQATYYSIDFGPTILYSAPFTVSFVGGHTVRFWSLDVASNTEATKSISFFIAAQAVLQTPTAGTVLPGSSTTFTWSAGSGISNYWLSVGTGPSGANAKNIYAGAPTTAVSATISGLPTYGQPIYVTLSSEINGAWQTTVYSFTESGAPVAAQLISPTPGSQLASSSVTFTWSPGGGVTNYWFNLGTGPSGAASKNLYSGASTTATSLTVSGLPTNGEILYATLYSYIAGAFQPTVYSFYATGPAVLTSPSPNSALGSSATFTWSPGTGIAHYWLDLGTADAGANAKNLYNSGSTTALNATVTGIPQYGETIYATLYSYISGAWQPIVYTYTASGSPVAAVLTTPTPSTKLSSSGVTFTWSAGEGVNYYWLNLGTTDSGAGAKNLYAGTSTTLTSVTATGLPTNGETIYATLYSYIAGVWQPTIYTYTASGSPTPAVLTTPQPGTALTNSTVTFMWSPGSPATDYWLNVGTGTSGAAAKNLYAGGSTTATSVTVTGLPTNGETIYATLYTLIGGAWEPTVYTYTAQ